MKRYYKYIATFEMGKNNHIGVYFHDLPGLASGGESITEAIKYAKEGLAIHIHGILEDKDPLPVPSKYKDIPCKKNESLCMIETDIAEYYPDLISQNKGGTRPGSGRKKGSGVGREAKTVISIRMNRDDFNLLDRISKKEHKTKSDLIREFIRSKQ